MSFWNWAYDSKRRTWIQSNQKSNADWYNEIINSKPEWYIGEDYYIIPKVQTADSPKLDIYHKFTTKDFDDFVRTLYPIFEDSLTRKGYSKTQIRNLIKQAANESAYGTDPRGSQGYNLGGIKWFNNPNSNTYKYKHSTGRDGLEYVDFNSLLDYADYKVDLLNNTYDALNAIDTADFINRLHGQNPYKKSYSASPQNYRTSLNRMKSLDKALDNYERNLVK